MWGYGPYGMMGYGGGWGSMGWMMLVGGAFWIFVLVLVVVAVVWIVRAPWRAGDHPTHWERRSPGLDILEERYARGEIDRDEYLQKKRDMLGRASTS